MRFILKVLRGEGAREREIDQRERKPGREGRSAGELRHPQPPGQLEFGRAQGGEEAEIPTFSMFLFSSSVSLHPNLQPWGPGSCADWRSKLGKKSNMTRRV